MTASCYSTIAIKQEDVGAVAPPDAELSSWKQIASFLGVSIRTAQTLERERGLPVRRLSGPRGRVLASAAELAAWKRNTLGGPMEPPRDPVAPDSPPSPAPVARPFPRWARYTTVLGLLLLVGIIGIAANRVRIPVTVRIDGNALVALDDQGRQCWRKIYPHPLAGAPSPEAAAQYSWIGDLGGRRVVLVALANVPGPLALVCYDRSGAELWRYSTTARVRTATQEFTPQFSPVRFLVTRLGRGRPDVILLAMTHTLYYPSQTVLLSATGQLLREYWHSGHLNHLQAGDLDGDGRNEFYLAGISNAWHAATLVVLDEDRFRGASQEPQAPDYQLLGMERGVERARVIMPRSCLSMTFDPYNSVHSLTVLPDQIILHTVERIANGGAGIIHHFAPDLTRRQTVFSDSYHVEDRALKAARLLPPSCKPDILGEPRMIAPVR